jgi:hypothetical protein
MGHNRRKQHCSVARQLLEDAAARGRVRKLFEDMVEVNMMWSIYILDIILLGVIKNGCSTNHDAYIFFLSLKVNS